MVKTLKLEELVGLRQFVAVIDYEGRICIEVAEPWAGDTETGLGRSAAVRLSNEQAATLARWLLAAAGVEGSVAADSSSLHGPLVWQFGIGDPVQNGWSNCDEEHARMALKSGEPWRVRALRVVTVAPGPEGSKNG